VTVGITSTGNFFVEPLFSLRFGSAPLAEITGLILEANQPVELHLHTEWVDEAHSPPVPLVGGKRQHLKYFSPQDQSKLIKIGKELLIQAGVPGVNAFRAGGFGFNIHSLSALHAAGIFVDCSYNATLMGLDSGLMPGQILTESIIHNGVHEVPMTVYYDRPGHLRHMQLCACSSRELEGLLWQALEQGRREVVILSHNFELLNESRSRPNSVIVKRFQKLCDFLGRNRDCFSVEDFSNFTGNSSSKQRPPMTSPSWKTGLRILEQTWSRYA
jgi:hypothetical protein